MSKDCSNLIGSIGGDDVRLVNGVAVITSNESFRIRRRISEINKILKNTVAIYQDYDERQHILRGKIKSDEKFTGYQLRKIKKTIFENRIILRGFATYISHLNIEKRKLEKAYTDYLKKKTENQN